MPEPCRDAVRVSTVPRFEAYGVRHRGYGNFQIFYRVKGDPPVQIDVLHVLHGARDYASILF